MQKLISIIQISPGFPFDLANSVGPEFEDVVIRKLQSCSLSCTKLGSEARHNCNISITRSLNTSLKRRAAVRLADIISD